MAQKAKRPMHVDASLGMGPRGLVLFSRTDACGEARRGMMKMTMIR